MRATHEARHRCVHNATGRLARNTPLSAFFAEVVCDAGASPSRTMTSPPRTATSPPRTATSPPRTATSPPANGGNCTIRGATRRRHAVARLLMLQNPHHDPNRVKLRYPKAQGPGRGTLSTRSCGGHRQARDAVSAAARRTPPTKTPTFPHQQAEKSPQNQHVLSFNPPLRLGATGWGIKNRPGHCAHGR